MGDLCLVGDKLSSMQEELKMNSTATDLISPLSCVSSGLTTVESDLQRGSVNVSKRRSGGFCRGSPGSNGSLAGQISIGLALVVV